jgi:hypothetical protein
MQRMTIKEALEHEAGIRAEAYRIENAPASGDWLFDQYTVEECRPYVERWRTTFPESIRNIHASTGNIYDVDEAEEAIIKLHRPYFNTAMNPHPLPLPMHYKSSRRNFQEAKNPYADKLTELFGIK